jgi:hypothetical protein
MTAQNLKSSWTKIWKTKKNNNNNKN